MSTHKNDMYGSDLRPRDEADADVAPPIPAATVVLLRDVAGGGVETLMLKKRSDISFGGMWVFPGGRIDAEDYDGGDDDDLAARRAAAREAEEEASLQLEPDALLHFSHWTPPPAPRKRFATWFFAAQAPSVMEVAVDQGEITDHIWISPQAALAEHAAQRIDVVPPTWVTLNELCQGADVASVMAHLADGAVRVYQTRVGKDAEGTRVAMWRGDAGYEGWDATLEGDRHRLTMRSDGFLFERTI